MTESPPPAGGPAGAAPKGERIAKVLARAGVCSRRDAERMILEGRVSVDGKRLDSPAVNVVPAQRVLVDGKPLPAAEPPRLWCYHKKKGLMTSHKDPEGRPTVFEKLPAELPRVISIGRLDFNSEGLLLLTNDGELARRLELPETGWMRRYRVRVYGTAEPAKLGVLAKGVTIEGVHYGPITAVVDNQERSNAWLTVGLREGKNREVRRVLEHVGLPVNRLIRIAYGPFQLGNLEPGQVREVPGKVLTDQLGGLLHGGDAANSRVATPKRRGPPPAIPSPRVAAAKAADSAETTAAPPRHVPKPRPRPQLQVRSPAHTKAKPPPRRPGRGRT